METTVIPVDQTITTALEKGNVTAQVLADLKQYNSLTIAGIDDKDGYKKVHEARMVCKNTRVLAQKLCKAGREEAIAVQKAWIGKEKEIVAQIEETENYLQKQQDAIDTEKERIAEEKREAERQRIQSRIDKLTTVGYALDFGVVSTISDEQFEETLAEATSLHNEELARLAKIEEEKRAEAARLEQQRIEQEKERQRLEAIEREQQYREARIKEEQEAEARKLRQEREAIEREKAAIEKQKQDAIAQEKRKAELEEARKQAAEQALKDAEAKRIADAKAEQERIERERVEAARIEAIKPVKEKLTEWVNSINLPLTDIDHQVVDNISTYFHDFKEWSLAQIEKL